MAWLQATSTLYDGVPKQAGNPLLATSPGRNSSRLIDKDYKAVISYSYKVDDDKYHGELKAPHHKAVEIVENNPKGKEMVVYYSKKDPWFSIANRPPSHFDIIGSTIAIYLLLPFVLVNLVYGYIFWLVRANESRR